MVKETSISPQVDEHDTESPSGSCRRKMLLAGRVLLHLGCAAYSLYLIWLLAYLKDNPYYWFLSLIPIYFSLMLPLTMAIKKRFWKPNTASFDVFRLSSASVVLTLMTCFTMLTRLAYYHRQPDEFIGPRFIILSLQGSIILIFLDFFLQREGKLEILLNYKDVLNRMILDFVDIFNMVEILSANECFGVGSFVSEESSTENAIQAFCTMSFFVVYVSLLGDITPRLLDGKDGTGPLQDEPEDGDHHSAEQQRSSNTSMERLYTLIILCSGFYQNLPFFIIRIVVWAQYNLYSLGFLVKNFIVIVLWVGILRKNLLPPGL